MSALRQQMHDAMLVRGFAVRTRQAYIEAIAKLAHFYHASPARLSPRQVEAWLLHLVRDRKPSFSTVNQAASACRFLYATVLKRDSAVFAVPMAKTPLAGAAEVLQYLSRYIHRTAISNEHNKPSVTPMTA